MTSHLTVIGGGLAGCEAAWQAANRGIHVKLFEMRPFQKTSAHQTGMLAELVCSNSLGSILLDRPSGLLKEELRFYNSLLLKAAEACSIPAGSALAVDRNQFAAYVTEKILIHPNITVIREEVQSLPDEVAIVASGPLTSPALSNSLSHFLGNNQLYFFDAIAPIVEFDSINLQIAFFASRSRFGVEGGKDYLNCPFSEDTYLSFVNELINAKRIHLKDYESEIELGVTVGRYFEGCLPIEILARRGKMTLAFGPFRPMGLIDPNSSKRPFAVVQLRQENQLGNQYNLVGFQTNLTQSEQTRIIHMIPGLEHAVLLRFGQMHKNTFINAPLNLLPSLQTRKSSNILFAGQIAGIEGYIGNIASGLLAGINAVKILKSETPFIPPKETLLGSLCQSISNSNPDYFQPVKANFGLLPKLINPPKSKNERAALYSQRALNSLVHVTYNNKTRENSNEINS